MPWRLIDDDFRLREAAQWMWYEIGMTAALAVLAVKLQKTYRNLRTCPKKPETEFERTRRERREERCMKMPKEERHKRWRKFGLNRKEIAEAELAFQRRVAEMERR